MIARDLCCGAVVDAGDDAAQHWRAVHAADGRICGQTVQIVGDLALLDINHEIGGGHIW